MVINRKPTGRAVSVPAGLTIGAAVSTISTLMIAIILGKLVDMEKLPWENIGYGIMLLILTASFLGATVAYMKIKRQRLLICLLSGTVYLGILLSATALFFGGQYESVGVTAALILAGSGSAGLLGLKENRGGKRKTRSVGYR